MIDRDVVLQQLRRARADIQSGSIDTGQAILALLHAQLHDACRPSIRTIGDRRIAWHPTIIFYRAAGRVVVAAETECIKGNTQKAAELLRTGIERLLQRGA